MSIQIIGRATAMSLITMHGALAQQQNAQSAHLIAALSVPGNANATSKEAVARLHAPPGFEVTVFADHLGGIRMLAAGTDGTVYATRRDSGDVIAVKRDVDGTGPTVRKVVRNLPHVHGIALSNDRMYLATIKEIYVAPLSSASVGEPTAIVTDLPDGGQHPNRTIAIGPDGMLYVSVGSDCNRCNEPNPEHATMLRMKTDGSARTVFARGLRNTVGWDWHPDTHQLWGMDHGSDWSGDEIPPEELNLLQTSSHYGWPWCYANREPDLLFASNPPGSTKSDWCPTTVPPALSYQAHSAPLQMVFYNDSNFPLVYQGNAFMAMHGSWNRQQPTGYKVVRVTFQNGQPVRFDDFLTGFLSNDGTLHYGRPAGLAVGPDGSLYVGDDTNGVIYRIRYKGPDFP